LEDVLQVGAHRVAGQVEAVGDLTVGEALGDEAYDAELRTGQAVPADRGPDRLALTPRWPADTGPAKQAAHARLVTDRTDAAERVEGLCQVGGTVRFASPLEEGPSRVFARRRPSHQAGTVAKPFGRVDQPVGVAGCQPGALGRSRGKRTDVRVAPCELSGGGSDRL